MSEQGLFKVASANATEIGDSVRDSWANLHGRLAYVSALFIGVAKALAARNPCELQFLRDGQVIAQPSTEDEDRQANGIRFVMHDREEFPVVIQARSAAGRPTVFEVLKPHADGPKFEPLVIGGLSIVLTPGQTSLTDKALDELEHWANGFVAAPAPVKPAVEKAAGSDHAFLRYMRTPA